MTTKTYQEFFSENLSEFGWTLSATDIPDVVACSEAIEGIGDWWNALDERYRNVFRTADFSQGLYDAGYFSAFPALYTVFAGNPTGHFDKTINDVVICGVRAQYQVEEQADEVSNVNEVVGA